MRFTNVTFSLTALASNSPSIAAGGIISAGLSNPPVKALSPNAIVTIFGANFAPAGTAAQAALVNGQLPTSLAGAACGFGAVAAPIFAGVSDAADQRAGNCPPVAPGDVPVRVITDCVIRHRLVGSPPVSVIAAQAMRPRRVLLLHQRVRAACATRLRSD